MGRRLKDSPPIMRRNGIYAYVVVGGERISLGKWGSPRAKTKFSRVIERWKNERPPIVHVTHGEYTLTDLATVYLAACAVKYRRRDGSVTDEYKANKRLLLTAGEDARYPPLVVAFPDLLAEEFDRPRLREFRAKLVAAKMNRAQINKHIGRIKRMFRWAAKEDIIEEGQFAKLALVDGLREGEGGSESEEVQPAPLRDIVAAMRAFKRQEYRDMVRLQYYIGCRPGELCEMMAEDIHKESVRLGQYTIRVPGMWFFTPKQHKTRKRGVRLAYSIGPRAQAILSPYLERHTDGRLLRLGYWAYAHAITAACRAAGVEEWTANQLRHNFTTRVSRIAGIATAQNALMHQHLATTGIYAERSLKDSAAIIGRIG